MTIWWRSPGSSVAPAILAIAVLAADAGWSPGGRAWQAAVCLALGAALAFAGWRLAGLLLEGEVLPVRLTGTFALAVGLSVVSATGLGAVGLLTPRWFELLIAVAAAAVLPGPHPPAPSPIALPPTGRGGEKQLPLTVERNRVVAPLSRGLGGRWERGRG